MSRECVTPLLCDFFNTSCFDRSDWGWWLVHGAWSSRDPAAFFRNNITAERAKRRQEQRESARRGTCDPWGCTRRQCEATR